MRRNCLKLLLVGLLLTGGFRAQAGVVLRVFYDEIVGDTVEDLVNASHFPNGPNPTIGALFVELLPEGLDTGPDTDAAVNDFGTHIRGFIEIPMDGDYQFFIASDDPSQLWMADPSTPSDNTSTNLVAFETGCCTEVFSGARLADRSSDPMTLSKGDKIYFETLHKEITGDEFIRVGWLRPDGVEEIVPGYHLAPFPLNEDPNNLQPISDVPPEIIDGYFGEFLPNPGQPQSLTVTEVDSARFTVTYLASQPVTIQWQKDGEDIPGANLSTYYIPEASLDDSGSQYTVTLSNEFGEVTSSAATLTVNPDNTAPMLDSARGSGNPHGLVVTFSEPVTEGTATDTANYAISGQDLTISGAEMLDTQTVLLSVSEFNSDPITLTVNGIEDRSSANNPIAADSTIDVTFRFPGLTSLFYEYPGGGLGGFYPTPRGIGEFPDNFNPFSSDPFNSLQNVQNRQSSVIRYFESPNTGDINTAPGSDIANNYGQVVFGLIVPEETADYTFHVATDDNSELYLSTDDNPENAVMIANEADWTGVRDYDDDGETTNHSEPISLQAGEEYYVEIIHQEGGGGDNLAVAWTTDGTVPATGANPIPEGVLFRGLEVGPLSFVQQPQSQSILEFTSVTFTAEVNGSDPLATGYQWFKDGEAISGADGPTLTLDQVPLSDDGAQFTVMAFNVNGTFNTLTSDPATLTVNADDQPPAVLSINGTPLLSSITVLFDEPITADSAENVDHYSITPAAGGSELAVDSATLLGNGRAVRLDTAEQDPGTRYDVAMENIADVTTAANAFTGTEQFISFREQPGGLTALFYENEAGGLDGFYPSPRGTGQYPDNYNSFGLDIFDSLNNVANRNSGVIRYFESPNTGDIDTAPPSDVANNYGQVLFGFIVPNETADYRFFVANDDNAELWLSTDEDPTNVQLIANEPEWNGVREYVDPDDDPAKTDHFSEPITLQAGQKYYVEYISQEGGGGDNSNVAWTTDGSVPPNGALPIPGDVLHSNLPVFDEPTVVSQSPPNGGSNIPNSSVIEVVLKDGETALVDQDSIVLSVDGQSVTPTVTKEDDLTTVSYAVESPFGDQASVTVELSYDDTEGGSDTLSWSFEASNRPFLSAGTRFIEFEDFNADIDGDGAGGEWIEGANGGPTGNPYEGGDYAGLAAVHEVDYFDQSGDDNGNTYRQGALVGAGQPPVQFAVFNNAANPVRSTFTLLANYKIGWTSGDDWLNYTRDFPEEPTEYDVYASLSSGGDSVQGYLELVTSDPTQTGQSTDRVGEFSGAPSGDWGTAIFYQMHEVGDPETPATVTLSGLNTIRFVRGGGAMDYDHLAFVPAGDGGNGETPEIDVSYADGTITLEWTGTLEAADTVDGPYQEVTGASSPMQVTPDEAGKFWRSSN